MKRIILCADGTWNDPERRAKKTNKPHPTNVLKVARGILPRSKNGVDQVVYYHKGVGTGGFIDQYTGGAFGHGLAKNVRSLYRFLVFNYEPGDEIYLFGFSRGAFTVRTLAGFINYVGLLEKDDEFYTPELFSSLYEKQVKKGTKKWQHAFRNIKGVRHHIKIKFIGVWDTVGSLGAPGLLGQIFNRKKYRFHDIQLNPNIENVFHALALDEKRKPFAPSLYVPEEGWQGELMQTWFLGAHSNVGGGYSPDGLANEALQWMVEKAEGMGLEFDSHYLEHYEPWFTNDLNHEDEYKGKYRLLGQSIRLPNFDSDESQNLHQCVKDRIDKQDLNYNPTHWKVPNPEKIVDTHRILRGFARLKSIDNSA